MRMSELFTRVQDDPRGLRIGLAARRMWIGLFALIALAALAGFIGQRPVHSEATAPEARMTLQAPDVVRGGLFFQTRIDIRALQDIEHPRLVFDDGWLEGMQVNSIEPAADSESSRDGRLVLSYGTLAAGDLLRIYLQFEVNPTNVGERSYGFELDDEERRIARIDRQIRVLP
jgi:hypothetical protein